MAREEESQAVPGDEVEFTVQLFRESDATRIVIDKRGDGTYDIVATFD